MVPGSLEAPLGHVTIVFMIVQGASRLLTELPGRGPGFLGVLGFWGLGL